MTKKIQLEDFLSPHTTEHDKGLLISLFKEYHRYDVILTWRYTKIRRIQRAVTALSSVAIVTLSALSFINPAISMGNIIVISLIIAVKKVNLPQKQLQAKFKAKEAKRLLGRIKTHMRSDHPIAEAEESDLLSATKTSTRPLL